jgi:hypothetical protein
VYQLKFEISVGEIGVGKLKKHQFVANLVTLSPKGLLNAT